MAHALRVNFAALMDVVTHVRKLCLMGTERVIMCLIWIWIHNTFIPNIDLLCYYCPGFIGRIYVFCFNDKAKYYQNKVRCKTIWHMSNFFSVFVGIHVIHVYWFSTNYSPNNWTKTMPESQRCSLSYLSTWICQRPLWLQNLSMQWVLKFWFVSLTITQQITS